MKGVNIDSILLQENIHMETLGLHTSRKKAGEYRHVQCASCAYLYIHMIHGPSHT